MTTATLDLAAAHSVKGYPGVAFRLLGFATEEVVEADVLVCEDDECDHTLSEMCWVEGGDVDTVVDLDRVVAVMIGDDRDHVVEVADLTKIDRDDYCGSCGQIGCTHDGRDTA